MADPAYNSPTHRNGRKAWGWHLANVGPVLCRKPGCGRLVYSDPAMNWDGKPWQLGHGVAVRHGGTGDDAAPEHMTCNESEGYAISQDAGLSVYQW